MKRLLTPIFQWFLSILVALVKTLNEEHSIFIILTNSNYFLGCVMESATID